MKLEVLWRQLVGIGAEHLVLSMDGEIHADGLSVGEVQGTAYRIHYQIDCDPAWNVRQVHIRDLLSLQVVALVRENSPRWRDGAGVGLDALDGCTDVDIMITPFTNTLPIRRLALDVGEAREVAVVYVALPGLVLSRVNQRYTCLARDENGGLYRYENLASGFSAEIRVDTDGLVADYPGIFAMDAKRRLQ